VSSGVMAFQDQVAIVTGASSGIGRAIALALAAQGAAICLVGRRLEALTTVAQTAGAPAQMHCYRADLTEDEDVETLVAHFRRDFGYLDLLVHSAGVFSMGPLESAPVQDLDWQYRTNVRAPYVLTQALLPMLRPRQGQIVFINSSAGMSAKANVGQYAATKHALKALADSLRAEVNAKGLRVLSVYPGRTATPMQAAIHEMENLMLHQARAYHPDRLMQPEDVADIVLNALCLPKSTEATDIHIRPMAKPS
jgi:NADP-dependent 3-hydroxy acid dehydrogenase YdfG